MDPASSPLLWGQRGEVGERVLATPPEGREGLADIIAEVLPVLGPSLRCGGLPVGLQVARAPIPAARITGSSMAAIASSRIRNSSSISRR